MTEAHVPVDSLAAYAAGDLDATAALEVEAHVLLCADCRADAEAIQRATGDLTALPPVTMPPDVAARIDAALAGEAAPAATPVVVPMKAPRKRPSFAGIAAVAAGVALLGAISVPLINGTGGNNAPTAQDQALREQAPATTRRLESGLNYTHDDLSATLLRAMRGVTAGGAAPAQPASGTPAASPAAGVASPLRTTADTAAEGTGGSQFSLRRLETAPALDKCVDALAASQTLAAAKVPLLVDYARYQGRAALVVVFPTESGGRIRPDRVDVWVVGARCGITPGDDDVLDFARFPRPEGL